MPCTIERSVVTVDRSNGREITRREYLQNADQQTTWGKLETAHLFESREAATKVASLQGGQRFVDVEDGQVIE